MICIKIVVYFSCYFFLPYPKFHTYNSLSLFSSLSSHYLIIGFASLNYNQSPCGFDTWTSILIFTTCDKIGTLINLLTLSNLKTQIYHQLFLSKGWKTLTSIQLKSNIVEWLGALGTVCTHKPNPKEQSMVLPWQRQFY